MAVITEQGLRQGLRKVGTAVMAVVIGYAAPAGAFEFGSLAVHSHLDQPLDATVVLDHLSASEPAGLDIGIAPPAMFKRFGIRRSGIVDRMQIDARYDKNNDRAYVHLSTQRPVDEPFVDFVLRVKAGDGSSLREYTAMLDPAGAQAATDATVQQPQDASPPSGAARRSLSGSATPAHRASAGLHRVRSGESLWSIADAATPNGATVAQTMLAIYHANPAAFGHDMNALRNGTALTVPGASTIRAVDASRARQRFDQTKTTDNDQSTVSDSGRAPSKSPEKDEVPATEGLQAASGHTPDRNTAPVSPDTRSDNARSGRLNPPAETPRPAPVVIADVHPLGPAISSGPATTMTNPASSSSNAAVTSNQSGAESSAASAPMSPNGALIQTATGRKTVQPVEHNAPPPIDVAAPRESGFWPALRDLLLAGIVLGLVRFVIRRLRARRGESARSSIDSSEGSEVESTLSFEPEAATAAAGAAHSTDTATASGVFIAGIETGQNIAPEKDRHEPPCSPTNEETEALAFESQALPDPVERHHDRGAGDPDGLAFDTVTMAPGMQDVSARTPAEDNPPNRQGLEMIDPGEFDLYDPLSETVGQPDDDANDRIENRLDLARMYLDREDQGAARDLLADVQERGDETQQRLAAELSEQT